MDTNLILGMDTSETLPNGYEQGFTWWIRTKLYLPTYLIDAKPLSQAHTDRCESCCSMDMNCGACVNLIDTDLMEPNHTRQLDGFEHTEAMPF